MKGEFKITDMDYRSYEYSEGDVVYCDIPYEGTKCDSYDEFDHKAFYDWVANRDYPVYFSSYDNISDDRFKIVFQKKHKILSDTSNKQYRNECLYVGGKA